jgi:hypothetical protein
VPRGGHSFAVLATVFLCSLLTLPVQMLLGAYAYGYIDFPHKTNLLAIPHKFKTGKKGMYHHQLGQSFMQKD